jgi:hypothetical protein
MPIDFSVEPELQAKLDWARDFVRREIVPLEVVDYRFMQVIRRLKAESGLAPAGDVLRRFGELLDEATANL